MDAGGDVRWAVLRHLSATSQPGTPPDSPSCLSHSRPRLDVGHLSHVAHCHCQRAADDQTDWWVPGLFAWKDSFFVQQLVFFNHLQETSSVAKRGLVFCTEKRSLYFSCWFSSCCRCWWWFSPTVPLLSRCNKVYTRTPLPTVASRAVPAQRCQNVSFLILHFSSFFSKSKSAFDGTTHFWRWVALHKVVTKSVINKSTTGNRFRCTGELCLKQHGKSKYLPKKLSIMFKLAAKLNC